MPTGAATGSTHGLLIELLDELSLATIFGGSSHSRLYCEVERAQRVVAGVKVEAFR